MIKASFRLILAALAATAALAGCTKEITPPSFENDKVNTAEGTRVIAVSFTPQTKTILNGLQPKFVNGKDTILLVSYPENSDPVTDTCVVTVDDKGIATISTNLTGALTAFYPAKAAQIDGRGNYAIYNTPVQTGKFADANLCSAAIGESDTNVEFSNLYSLFIITPPDGTLILKIKSLKGIGEDGQRSGNSAPINIINSVIEASKTITIPNGPDEDGKYYVVIVNAKLSDLSFEAWFDENGTTGSIKGIPTRFIEQQAAATGIENYRMIQPGTAYTIDDSNWHPYVTVAGRKWATMNVGAETPEEFGDYFAYGEVVGHKAITGEVPSGTITGAFTTDFGSFDFTDNNRYTGTLDKNAGFAQCNSPYYDNNDYSTGKYNITTGKQVLDLADDGANANWGGAWRMPTREEIALLTQETVAEGDSPMGITIGTGENIMFIPFAGCGKGNDLKLLGYYFLSSSLCETGENVNKTAYVLFYGEGSSNNKCESETVQRYLGFPIRAIIDDPDAVTPPAPEEQEDVLLPGCFTVGSDKEVYFTKGNLYWDGSKWAIEENQYDFSPYSSGYVSDHVSLLFWTKDAGNAYAATCPESEDEATGVDKLFCDGSDADHFLTIGGNAGLYALSFDEWNYLLNTRTDAGSLHREVSITVEEGEGPIHCLAIAPDRCIGTYSFDSSKTTYTLAEYTAATAAGVLFLPVAGFRLFGTYEEENAMCGYYWTSTPSDELANVFDLADTQFENSACGRGSGCSIRLVKKVTQAEK